MVEGGPFVVAPEVPRSFGDKFRVVRVDHGAGFDVNFGRELAGGSGFLFLSGLLTVLHCFCCVTWLSCCHGCVVLCGVTLCYVALFIDWSLIGV